MDDSSITQQKARWSLCSVENGLKLNVCYLTQRLGETTTTVG